MTVEVFPVKFTSCGLPGALSVITSVASNSGGGRCEGYSNRARRAYGQ